MGIFGDGVGFAFWTRWVGGVVSVDANREIGVSGVEYYGPLVLLCHSRVKAKPSDSPEALVIKSMAETAMLQLSSVRSVGTCRPAGGTDHQEHGRDGHATYSPFQHKRPPFPIHTIPTILSISSIKSILSPAKKQAPLFQKIRGRRWHRPARVERARQLFRIIKRSIQGFIEHPPPLELANQHPPSSSQGRRALPASLKFPT